METTEYQVIIHQFEKLEKRLEHLIRSLESQEEKNLELANKMGRLEEELRKGLDQNNVIRRRRPLSALALIIF